MQFQQSLDKIKEKLAQLGFENSELLIENAKIDARTNSGFIFSEHTMVYDAVHNSHDKIEFSVLFLHTDDIEKTRIERIFASYIRKYESDNQAIIFSHKEYRASQKELPGKSQIIAELETNFSVSKIIGLPGAERKVISDRAGDITRQLTQIGFEAQKMIVAATHHAGDRFVVYATEFPKGRDSRNSQQYISFLIGINDSPLKEESGIMWLTATQYERSADQYEDIELAYTHYLDERTPIPHKDEIIRELDNQLQLSAIKNKFNLFDGATSDQQEQNLTRNSKGKRK